MNKLKNCPFCGGEAFIATVEHSAESRPYGYRFHGQIMCRKCQASCGTTGFDKTKEEADRKAITAWNRRAEEDKKYRSCMGCPIPEGVTDEEVAEALERPKAKAENRILPEGFSCVESCDDKTLYVFHPEGKRVTSGINHAITVSVLKIGGSQDD